MSVWARIGIAAAALVVLYAALLPALLMVGRAADARAPARRISCRSWASSTT